MALPPNYNTPSKYFEDSLIFFEEYQNLYNFPNTDVLVKNILSTISITELDDIDIFNDEFDLEKTVEDSDFLNNFFDKLNKLKPVYNEFIEDVELQLTINAPLGPKKKHEILYLAKEIERVCENVNCEVVVDFGSGLGYLDQHLHETTNYKVLGIECNEKHYVAAKKRQRKYHINSLDHVKYIKHTITEQSETNIESFVQDKFYKNKFCIAGLHACADLTVDAVNLFLKMADCQALVIMPCCYHKLTTIEDNFKNFPLSNSLNSQFLRHRGFEYLKIPFLRLATQPPRYEGSLEDMVFNLLARAILQLYTNKHKCKLKRKKRKAVKLKNLGNDFASYINDAKESFTLISDQFSNDNEDFNPSNICDDIEFDSEEVWTLWRQITNLTFKKAGILILLQNYLQPIFENFVLYDRIVYLQEKGINNCKFKKIFDSETSPRCLALIAVK